MSALTGWRQDAKNTAIELVAPSPHSCMAATPRRLYDQSGSIWINLDQSGSTRVADPVGSRKKRFPALVFGVGQFECQEWVVVGSLGLAEQAHASFLGRASTFFRIAIQA